MEYRVTDTVDIVNPRVWRRDKSGAWKVELDIVN